MSRDKQTNKDWKANTPKRRVNKGTGNNVCQGDKKEKKQEKEKKNNRHSKKKMNCNFSRMTLL